MYTLGLFSMYECINHAIFFVGAEATIVLVFAFKLCLLKFYMYDHL